MPMPALPTMSSAGILTEPKQIASYLFDCFLASENSQSTSYPIYSLPYLVETCTGRITALPNMVTSALQGLYGAFFESITSNVTLVDYIEEPEKVVLSIRMTMTSDGNHYDLARLVERIGENEFRQIVQ
jgi:hypothetical protein